MFSVSLQSNDNDREPSESELPRADLLARVRFHGVFAMATDSTATLYSVLPVDREVIPFAVDVLLFIRGADDVDHILASLELIEWKQLIDVL